MREHIRSNVVGYVALFCFAMAGTAGALPGRNTVTSNDIVNGEVKRADLRAGAVNAAKVADGSIGAAELADGSVGAGEIGADAVGFSELDAAAFNADIAEQGDQFGIPNDAIQGFEVEDDSLGGADINEATLNGGNASQLGGRGPAVYEIEHLAVSDTDGCDPTTSDFLTCASTEAFTPAILPTSALVTATGSWFGTGTGADTGQCILGRNSLNLFPEVHTHQSAAEHTSLATAGSFAITTIDTLGTFGPHTWHLRCAQDAGNVLYDRLRLSVAVLTDGI